MKLFLCLAFLVAVALAAPGQQLVKRDDSAAAASSAASSASTTIVQIQNGPPGGYGGGYGGGYNGGGPGSGPVGGDAEAHRDHLIEVGAKQVIDDVARPFKAALSIGKGFLSG